MLHALEDSFDMFRADELIVDPHAELQHPVVSQTFVKVPFSQVKSRSDLQVGQCDRIIF